MDNDEEFRKRYDMLTEEQQRLICKTIELFTEQTREADTMRGEGKKA